MLAVLKKKRNSFKSSLQTFEFYFDSGDLMYGKFILEATLRNEVNLMLPDLGIR